MGAANIIPIASPPCFVAIDDGVIYLVDLAHEHRYTLTRGQARDVAHALLALADGLPLVNGLEIAGAATAIGSDG